MEEGGVVQGEFGGGIVYIVSALKTDLETGETLAGPAEAESVAAR
jgi:hypothetical protein